MTPTSGDHGRVGAPLRLRTLLIDNYDSYTYNLFQLAAEVNGVEPTVLANDAVDGDRLDLTAFDNIVISPGPGHPGRARDFGVSAAALSRATIPVLGVCLGHQGIVTGAGGRVEPAPAARHGHLTTVRHDGDELFRGIPAEFRAVRYHSMCAVQPLPRTLTATAWAEDGVVMALRHRTRPQWGVQFHPESILTEFGVELLRNFGSITAARASGPRARIEIAGAPGDGAVPVVAPSVPATVCRLHLRVVAHEADTEAVFGELHADQPNAFWLDSAQTDGGRARFSYLGDGSGPLAELASYDVADGAVLVRAVGRPTRQVPGTIFDYLQAELRRRVVDAPALPFDFTGGYVGYLGYETKADCGSPNRHRAGTPDATWLFADRMVVVDHRERRTYALALDDGSARTMRDNLAWLDRAHDVAAARPVAPTGPSARGPVVDVEPWLVRDRERYLADIEACQAELLAGESYEICLTNAARVPAAGDGLEFYRALRRSNPAPYAAYLRFGDVEVACSSPERFLRLGRDRTVEAKPIKGTAPRVADPDLDSRIRRELATSAKTRAENLMIVDLLRNDLGRVCRVGSVHVPHLMAVESYRTVHQLVSTVRGELREGLDAVDAVRACFPGGSMTGAPKLRTMQIIDRLEDEARGIYSGAIGYLSCNGTADLNIVIRTAVLHDGGWHVGVGGAIILDSDPADEFAETLLKGAATLAAMPAVERAEAVS